MYASNFHSYTHLIVALSIVRKSTVWVFITSKYPGTHDIGLPMCIVVCRGVCGADRAGGRGGGAGLIETSQRRRANQNQLCFPHCPL